MTATTQDLKGQTMTGVGNIDGLSQASCQRLCRHETARRMSLDELITDAEAAIAKLEEKPGRFGGPVRQQIAHLSYRLEVLEEARDLVVHENEAQERTS